MNTQNKNKDLELFEMLSPYFVGLGDPVRQQIVALLMRTEHLNVSQIADQVPMSRPTISHHIKILKQAGLLSVQKKGTENYYRLEFNDAISLLKQLVTYVEEECIPR